MNQKPKIFKIKKIHPSLKWIQITNESSKIWERDEIVYFHAITLIKSHIKTKDKKDINTLFETFLKKKTKLQIYSKGNCSKREIRFVNDYMSPLINRQLLSENISLKEMVFIISPLIHDCLKAYYEKSVNKMSSIDKFDDYCFKSNSNSIEIRGEEHFMDRLIDFADGVIDYRSIANFIIDQESKSSY